MGGVPAAVLPFSQAVDIGGGRGRLAAPAAASLRRVDAAFGRLVDVNEAWRSPEQADANYRAYVAYRAYLAGMGPSAPWAPLAYPAATSVHCRGYAVDTDDTSAAQMRVWSEHGWFWTVYRNGVLVERWHLEYFPDRDQHRSDLAGDGVSAPFPEPLILEDSMSHPVAYAKGDKVADTYAIYLDAGANNDAARYQGGVYCARRYVTPGELAIVQASGFKIVTIPQAQLDVIPKVYGSK